MRLAVNASIVDRVLSGLGVYTVNVCNELSKLREDLIVYTSCPDTSQVDLAKVRKISKGGQPARGQKGHVYRIGWAQTILPLRLRTDRASLVLSPLPEGMLFPSVPQVIVVHDILPLRFPEEYPRQQYYFRYFVRMILRKAKAIVADSEHTKRDILSFYGLEPARIHVVPAGYDNRRYRLGIDAWEIKQKYGLTSYFFYVGNLLPHKNIRRLLQAFACIAPECSHKLVITGSKDPRYFPSLEVEVRVLGIQNRVLFLDYVMMEDLPSLYAGATAFVFPSLYEGFGLPPLEAMACGTPVITSNVSSLPEVVGEAALLVDPYDVDDLSKAMRRVMTEEGLSEELRRKGLDRAKAFSWEATAKSILKICEDVHSGGRLG